MQAELTQLTRKKLASASDPVQYARSQAPDIADICLSPEAAELPSKFADILEYPDDAWRTCADQITASLPAGSLVAEHFAEFCDKTQGMSLIELQELYAQSFDLNPNCALEIGYHLFGEDYKRGAFLANLRETQGDLELGQEQQLPDYLPVLLRLLLYLEDDDLRGSLAGHCMVPGIRKIIGAFKQENPFVDLLKSILAALEKALSEAGHREVVFG